MEDCVDVASCSCAEEVAIDSDDDDEVMSPNVDVTVAVSSAEKVASSDDEVDACIDETVVKASDDELELTLEDVAPSGTVDPSPDDEVSIDGDVSVPSSDEVITYCEEVILSNVADSEAVKVSASVTEV